MLVVIAESHSSGALVRSLLSEGVLVGADGTVHLPADGARLEATAREALRRGSLRAPDGRSLERLLASLAPEQRDPDGAVDARADVFGWGVLLFELLTGELPSGAEVPGDVLPGLDARLDALYRRATAGRAGRFRDAEAALAELDAVLGAASTSTSTSTARGEMPLAGVGPRAVAFALDALPFAVLALAVRSALPLLAIPAADALATVATGRTPGKWLIGLRVSPREPWRLLLRSLARVASLATGAGALLLLGRGKRALHDRLTGTRVEHA